MLENEKLNPSLDITSRMWLTPVYPEKNTTHLENLSTRSWLITSMKHVVCRSAVRARVYSLLKLKLFFQCVKFIHLHYTYAQCTYKVHMYLIMRATWTDKLVKLWCMAWERASFHVLFFINGNFFYVICFTIPLHIKLVSVLSCKILRCVLSIGCFLVDFSWAPFL